MYGMLLNVSVLLIYMNHVKYMAKPNYNSTTLFKTLPGNSLI